MNIDFARDLDSAAREIHVFVLFGLENGSDDLKDLVLDRFHAGFGVAGVCISHDFLCFFRVSATLSVSVTSTCSIDEGFCVPVVYMTVVFMAVVFMTFVLKFRYFRSKNGEFFSIIAAFCFRSWIYVCFNVCRVCCLFFMFSFFFWWEIYMQN